MNEDGTNWQGEKASNWIGTLHGNRIDLSAPKPECIDVLDVTAGLGNQCRFTGQVREFYSIAEHSIHVCELVIRAGYPELALPALMHDGPEAYIGDVSTPLKNEIAELYKPVEQKLRNAFDVRFGLRGNLCMIPQVIRDCDVIALMTERDALVVKTHDWGPYFENAPRDKEWVHRWPNPRDARNAFLAKYVELARTSVPRAVTVW